MDYYSAFKKEGILISVKTWMNSGNIILSEISQAQKKKYCMISPLVESKKKKKANLNFSGSPVVKTTHFHCKGCRFSPWSGKLCLLQAVAPNKTKQTKDVKLLVSFRDYGYFHNLDHGDSIMDIHINQNISNGTLKNKNLQATSLCSGFMASSAKLSDNKQFLF